MIKIALDNQVSKDVVKRLSSYYDVVVWAADRSDEDWVDEAMTLGAQYFISPDLDVPNLLDRYGYDDVFWIDLPQNLKFDSQFDFIRKKIKGLKNKGGNL